ncbi:MAG: ATP synthase F1 subunit gamma [Acidobacteriota bacterium]|nr:ATP synthase F1 subunit gamma [Acidobacteriota bacterium]
MPALIDLRRRIKSVRNTQQITQAMKTVATAKFKKSQRTVLEARPYWHSSPDLISEIALWVTRESHPLLSKRKEKKIIGIVITSDKGLCGAFNSNLLEGAKSYFEEKSQTSDVRLILIGEKARSFFKNSPYTTERSYSDAIQKLTEEDFNELAQLLIHLYLFHKVDAVYVVYNEFKSILAPRITIAKILPIEPPEKKAKEAYGDELEYLFPDWEPAMIPLLQTLLPLYIKSQFRHFFFESSVAEHAARMMAMDNATKNAEDLVEELTMDLNKIRQALITKELLEIMTAVEALAKK